MTAVAGAEATTKVGMAEAEVILAKGRSTAEAYKLEVDAMERDAFSQIRIVDKIASNHVKLIPENFVIGGAGKDGSGDMMSNFFGISLFEKLTGKEFGKERKLIAEK